MRRVVKQKSAFIDCREHVLISELIEGHRIEKFGDNLLQLSNGVTLEVIPNESPSPSSGGDFWLTHLQSVDHIITKVEPVVHEQAISTISPEGKKDYGEGDRYSLYVIAENERIKVLSVDGWPDDVGIYGDGFELRVRLKDLPERLLS